MKCNNSVYQGPFCVNMRKELLEGTMDPLVLIDAIAVIMGCEEKDLCKPGQLALTVIVNTANSILGSRERVGRILDFTNTLRCYPKKESSCIT